MINQKLYILEKRKKKIARNLRGLTRSSSSSSSSFLVVICFGGAFGATIAIMESANRQT